MFVTRTSSVMCVHFGEEKKKRLEMKKNGIGICWSFTHMFYRNKTKINNLTKKETSKNYNWEWLNVVTKSVCREWRNKNIYYKK